MAAFPLVQAIPFTCLREERALVALQQRGLEVRTSNGTFLVQVQASDSVKGFGSVDCAIVAVKTYSLPHIAPSAAALAKNGALILPLLNGVDKAEHLIEHAFHLGTDRDLGVILEIFSGMPNVEQKRDASQDA